MDTYYTSSDRGKDTVRGTLAWDTMQRDSRQNSRWVLFWLEFFIIFTCVLSLGYWMTANHHLEDALLVGIIGTSLGVLGIFISAVTGPAGLSVSSARFWNPFDHPIDDFLARRSLEEVCEDSDCRADAYRLLKERATQEREARRFVNRLLSIGVVTALSLVLLVVFREPVYAAFNMIFGLLITQTQHYSMPSAAMKAASLLETQPGALPD